MALTSFVKQQQDSSTEQEQQQQQQSSSSSRVQEQTNQLNKKKKPSEVGVKKSRVSSSSSGGGGRRVAAGRTKPGGAIVERVKRAHRYRSGTRSLMLIRRYQKTTNLLLLHSPFQRLVRQIAQECCGIMPDLRFSKDAIMALQVAAEDDLIRLYSEANLAVIHRKKKKVTERDMQFIKELRDRL